MKVVIPGGSGQIGTVLARHFHAKGDEVVVLSRRKADTPWRTVVWDAQTRGEWFSEIDGADVVINLAGKSVNCRYSWKNRVKIWESRSRSVRILGEAINSADSPPSLWLQASTATIYADRYDQANDEVSGIIGGTEEGVPETWRFSIDVARAWEGELALVEAPKTRKVALRSSMTMSPDRGGIFDYLLWLVRMGLGGTAASGEQFVSWIHYKDFIRAIEWLIDHEELEGPINLTSPTPVPNAQFMKELRQAWGQKIGLPAFKWMLEVGAVFLRTESEMVLKSRRVVPTLLVESGFEFAYGEWEAAVADLCKEWKDGQSK